MSILSQPIFHDEQAAYDFLESVVWPDGPTCPHCGGVERIGKMGGESTRIGTYKCYQCRKPFTVKVGTVFEASHVPLRKWLQAAFLMCSSKKGISAHQLHRTLEVSYPTAWFMEHRIREAMRSGELAPMGGLAESSRLTRRSSETIARSSPSTARRAVATRTSTRCLR
jgi:transposase-like protein